MSDIVERLRADLAIGCSASMGDTQEAADEIVRLRAERDRLRDALKHIEWSNDSKWQSDCAGAALNGGTQ